MAGYRFDSPVVRSMYVPKKVFAPDDISGQRMPTDERRTYPTAESDPYAYSGPPPMPGGYKGSIFHPGVLTAYRGGIPASGSSYRMDTDTGKMIAMPEIRKGDGRMWSGATGKLL